MRKHPIANVIWVPLDQVSPNDYNPNSVARQEMALLYHSIKVDGYTQPVVTVYDPERDVYVIVDGFHRYWVCRTHRDIFESTGGKLPVVVIDADLAGRMGATVRHNRARGKHSPDGMANLVFALSEMGRTEDEIATELGTSPDEIHRLRHITGFSKLYADGQYSRSWKLRAQLLREREFLQARDAPADD